MSGPERVGKDIQKVSEEEGRWEGEMAGVFKKRLSASLARRTYTDRERMDGRRKMSQKGEHNETFVLGVSLKFKYSLHLFL